MPDHRVSRVCLESAAHTGLPSNRRVCPSHIRVARRRNPDKSQWRSVRSHPRADLIFPRDLLSYQKTISLFASRAESEEENHRYLPKQWPDSDFSCLSGQTFFLSPWLQMPLHGSCPEPGLRKRLYPRCPALEFPWPQQHQNSPRPEQAHQPPVSACRTPFPSVATPQLHPVWPAPLRATQSLTSKK